jgi:hypothetical protein
VRPSNSFVGSFKKFLRLGEAAASEAFPRRIMSLFDRLFGRKKAAPLSVVDAALSTTERFMLSLFLKPRLRSTIVGPGWGDLWASRLGRRPEAVIDQFQCDGLLRRPDVAGILAVKFRVPELADLCKSYGFPSKGKKDELIYRLVDNVEASDLAKHLGVVDALVCTEIGREIGEAFKVAADGYRAQTEHAALTALRSRSLKEACQIVFEFESKQPLPRGIGVDWSRTDYSRELGMLEEIFSQPEGNNEELLAAAQAVLWGTSPTAFLPKRTEPRRRKTPEEKAAELEAQKKAMRASQRETLRSYKANRDVLIGVSVLAAGSSCEHCKSMQGDYTFENVPTLPHDGCTHPMGCRCCYSPLTSLSERRPRG